VPDTISFPKQNARHAMSVTPTNTDLESIWPPSALNLGPTPQQDGIPGRDALEALLAFSALHQQIRWRREAPGADEQINGLGPRQFEQFVLDEVLQLLAERGMSLTGADGIAIALAEHDAIVCRASAGKIAPDLGIHIDPRAGFSGACLVSGEIVRCDDTERDSRVNALACRNLGARSMVAVPLSAKQTVIGLIEAFSKDASGFNDADVRSLTLLAELLLAALKPEEEEKLAEVSRRVVAKEQEVAEIVPEVTAEQEPKISTVAAEEAQLPAEPSAAVPASPHIALPAPVVEISRPGLGIVAAVVLFAIVLGIAMWWKMSRAAIPAMVSVHQHPVPAAKFETPTPQTAPETVAVKEKAADEEDQSPPKPVSAEQLATLPQVTAIRHWSSDESSTVVVDLQDQVQYEAHRLANPERIYFDLHDTRLAPELWNKSIELGETMIQRVRVAQLVPGITRVVLETKGSSNFAVSLETNPYRLVVEIRKIGSKPQAKSTTVLFPSAPEVGTPVQAAVPKLRVVLDAGHGGWDLGTVGKQGLMEKDLVLDVVGHLGKLLERRLGAEVIYTRKDDSYMALEKRAEIANLADADFFLSVHANYSTYASARGVETYYSNTYSSVKARPQNEAANTALQNVDWTNVDIREKVQQSHRLATSIQQALYATLAKKSPGLPNRGVKEAQYVVLTGTTMPAVLAEISFVSSPADEDRLQTESYRQQIAEAIYQGVAHYAAQSKRMNMASNSGRTKAQ